MADLEFTVKLKDVGPSWEAEDAEQRLRVILQSNTGREVEVTQKGTKKKSNKDE